MKGHHSHLARLIVIGVVCLGLIPLSVFAADEPENGPNLLVNGGMEGKYVMQCSARNGAPWVAVPCGDPVDFGAMFLWATTQVPVGWTAWWQPPNTDRNDPNFYNNYPNLCYKEDAPRGCAAWHNPEYRDTAGGPQTPPSRKVAGDNSQKYFTFYSLHEAGLYQTVGGIQPGARLRFSVYMQAWASQANDPFTSAGQPTMGMKVGIDPLGGNNPWSPNIIWSPVKEAFDHWELFSVQAVARADRVTVFTRSRPYFAIQHNDVYVDEASLVVVANAVRTVTARGGTASPAQSSAPADFRPGRTVIVGATGGLRLRIRTAPSFKPGTTHVAIVPPGAELLLLQGPRIEEGFVWWKVREPESKSDGWVAQRFLRALVTPTPTSRATSTPRVTGTPQPTSTPTRTVVPRVTPALGHLTVGGYAAVSTTDGRRVRLRSEAGATVPAAYSLSGN